MKNWYFIVTDVSEKTVKNWNRMQISAYFGGGAYFINVRNTGFIAFLDIDFYVLGYDVWVS